MRAPGKRIGYDKPVERIASPMKLARLSDDLLQWFFAERQTDLIGEGLKNLSWAFADPSDLIQELQFEVDHRGHGKSANFQSCLGGGRQEVYPA